MCGAWNALRSDPRFIIFSLIDCGALQAPQKEGNGGRGVRRPQLVSRARHKRGDIRRSSTDRDVAPCDKGAEIRSCAHAQVRI